ncbi:hypothetical protein BN961_01903 [Afipia felis]|uniref:Uncharacterized protein n=1 Tax=Afipia felis TaxID=1035 RepID=A0A090MQH5_AFIFE|nr:hypothetical protein BN961_01903 [Afipia felis]
MRNFHDVVPGLGGQRATRHAVGRGIVVVAVPDTADEVAGVADEPCVAIGIGGAGLACGGNAVELRAPCGAFRDDVAHHHRHVGGDGGRNDLARLRPVAVIAPDQIARAGAHFQDRMRCHRLAAIGERRIGDGVFEHVDFIGADRQRRRVGQWGDDAEPARDFHDLGASGFRAGLAAERDRQLHRDDVDRVRQRLRQRDRAGVGAPVVLRAPVADADRAVHHDGGRFEAVQECRGVDVRFERGAGLAHRVGGTVELAGAVVASADHRAHAAIEIGDHGGCLRRMIVAAELAQLVLDGVLGRLLHLHIDGGAHHEHALGVGFREGGDDLLHLVEGVVEEVVRRILVAAVHDGGRVTPGAEHLAFGHEACVHEVVEHDVGAGARRGQVDVRRVFGRRLEQAREHRGFGEVHVARRFVEVEMRGAVDAERAAAHIGAVEIEFENFVLGQARLQPDREERLVDLALDGALVRQEQVLGELLGDRGAALAYAAGLRVGEERAQRARDVDTEMIVEAAILGGECRLDQAVGKLF